MRNNVGPCASAKQFDSTISKPSKPCNSLKERLLPLREHAPSTASAFTVGQGKMCSVSCGK
jgi:hypothetical protein